MTESEANGIITILGERFDRIDTDIAGVLGVLGAQHTAIQEIRTDMDQKFQEVRTDMARQFQEVTGQFQDLHNDLQGVIDPRFPAEVRKQG